MNEENKEEVKQDEYSIPGVIIPKQQTDSGILGSDTKNNEHASSNDEVSNSNEGIFSIPGVVIPEQQTDNGTIQTINNVTEESQYKPPEKETINITEQPILPGMMPENKNEEVKKTKNKKVKQEGNAKIGCLTIIVILLLAAVLYFVYITYINPPKISSEDAKKLNAQIFNKKGFVVQELYSWVNIEGCNSLNTILYNTDDVTKVSSLTDSDKLYLAYLQLKNTRFYTRNCTNYSISLHSNDKDNKWYCGSGYLNSDSSSYDDKNDSTLVLEATFLKNQVNKMFGQGEYKAGTFKINEGARYLYDSKNDVYILQTSDSVLDCTEYTSKLLSVKNSDSDIILNISLTNKKTSDKMTKSVRFIKSSDGNYYFDSIYR